MCVWEWVGEREGGRRGCVFGSGWVRGREEGMCVWEWVGEREGGREEGSVFGSAWFEVRGAV